MQKDTGADQTAAASPAPHDTWGNLVLPIALILGLVMLLSLSSGQGTTAELSPLEIWLRTLVGYLAAGAEIAAGLVIGIAMIKGLWAYARQIFIPGPQQGDATENIRLRLGRSLALGLEFTVASDILRTAVAPTRQDILSLGAIVLLRTLLNYFLEVEIRRGEHNRSVPPQRF